MQTITEQSLPVVDERIKANFKAIEHENIYQSWLTKGTLLSKAKRTCMNLGLYTFWKLEDEYNKIVSKEANLNSSCRKIIGTIYNKVIGE